MGAGPMDDVVVHGWRRIAVRRWGEPAGEPVFLLHGTPGSRLGLRPSEAELRRLGVCLITYDRPGYGRSDPHPGRVVADAAADVDAIANAFGYRRFGVLGRSGGGPHALACAALLPDRVTRVASLVSLAPYGVNGLDWLAGMVESNQRQYGAAAIGHAELAGLLYPWVIALRTDPEHMLNRIEADAPTHDRTMLADPEYRAALIAGFAEAVGTSVDGWLADSLALTRPWGFDLRWINVPTLLWHGLRDVFSPASHARWLAGRIKGAVLMLAEGAAHLNAAAVQLKAINWILSGTFSCN
jgi:pimeloyl-ACP methyl ester carboxylesterase